MKSTFATFMVVSLAVLGASACGGSGSAGSGSMQGPSSFTAKSALAAFATFQDGGLDRTLAEVVLSQLTHDEFCKSVTAQSFAGVSGPYAAILVTTEPIGNDLGAGTFPIASAAVFGGSANPPDAGFSLVQRGDLLPDGGTTSIAVDQSGTVTLTQVTFPKVLADGGLQGGALNGTFSSTLTLDGGATQSLSGTFSATGCN